MVWSNAGYRTFLLISDSTSTCLRSRVRFRWSTTAYVPCPEGGVLVQHDLWCTIPAPCCKIVAQHCKIACLVKLWSPRSVKLWSPRSGDDSTLLLSRTCASLVLQADPRAPTAPCMTICALSMQISSPLSCPRPSHAFCPKTRIELLHLSMTAMFYAAGMRV